MLREREGVKWFNGRMFADVFAFMNDVLGLDRSGNELGFWHMMARTSVVFLVAVVLVRLADRRFLSHHAGFDMIVAVVLGSVLSRAINGDARFFPTLAASTLLVVLHHFLASLTFRSHLFSQLVKGQPRVLVRNGVVDREAMQHAKITPDDLEANLRLQGNVGRLEDVAEARLERSGAISVLRGANSYPKTHDTPAPADGKPGNGAPRR